MVDIKKTLLTGFGERVLHGDNFLIVSFFRKKIPVLPSSSQ